MHKKKEIIYIEFDEFVNNSGFKESTIKRNYKRIPGIQKRRMVIVLLAVLVILII